MKLQSKMKESQTNKRVICEISFSNSNLACRSREYNLNIVRTNYIQEPF